MAFVTVVQIKPQGRSSFWLVLLQLCPHNASKAGSKLQEMRHRLEKWFKALENGKNSPLLQKTFDIQCICYLLRERSRNNKYIVFMLPSFQK